MREEMGTSSSREATLAVRPSARLTIREGGDGPVTGGQGTAAGTGPCVAQRQALTVCWELRPSPQWGTRSPELVSSLPGPPARGQHSQDLGPGLASGCQP